MTDTVSSSSQDPLIAAADITAEEVITNAAIAGSFSSGANYTFFGAFDGTNNDYQDLPLSGSPNPTNVYELYTQVLALKGATGVDPKYYAGLGTALTLPGSSGANYPGVTLQAQLTAKGAYDNFQADAISWLVGDSKNPSHPGASVSVSLTSFSRGDATAAIFSQLVFENGLIDPNNPQHYYVMPGQVNFSGGVLFDPVTTEVTGNLAFAPNAKNLASIVAANEYRDAFEGTNYAFDTAQVYTEQFYGNHVDIGGGYDHGIGALTGC